MTGTIEAAHAAQLSPALAVLGAFLCAHPLGSCRNGANNAKRRCTRAGTCCDLAKSAPLLLGSERADRNDQPMWRQMWRQMPRQGLSNGVCHCRVRMHDRLPAEVARGGSRGSA